MGTVPVFTPIANITSFKGPGIKRGTDDVTAHDSPNRYRQFIGTLVDAGEITIDINYDPAVHNALVSDFEDIVARDYRLIYPLASSQWQIKAFLVEFENTAPTDGKMTATSKFKITGKPVVT
jgi:predicted secreted protein